MLQQEGGHHVQMQDSTTCHVAVLDLLPYFQLVSQIALVFGAVFAGYQFMLHRRQRDEEGALDVLTRLQNPEFQRAYAQVWDLPLGLTAEQIRERGKGLEEAIDTVALTFESLGVMVVNRIVPLETVDDVIGGFLRESWRRLQPYVEWKRETLKAPRWAEWYHWLAVQVDAGRRRRSVPAYEAFKDWRE